MDMRHIYVKLLCEIYVCMWDGNDWERWRSIPVDGSAILIMAIDGMERRPRLMGIDERGIGSPLEMWTDGIGVDRGRRQSDND